jgi:pimeloyl-ACP methyl ester carboxylesterase
MASSFVFIFKINPSMKPKLTGTRYRNIHLISSILLFVLAAIFRKNKLLRNTFASLSIVEMANAATRFKNPAIIKDETEPMASELVKSALIDGILMRWEEHGKVDGMPIVFVHGMPTQPRLWRYVIPKMALTGLHCFAWEMVGYGWSLKEGLGKDISVAKQAEYLHMWLRQMNINQAIFVGHDIGGGVIQRLAVEHPECFMGMVLADCIAYDNWPIASVKHARRMAGFIEMLPAALLKPFFLSAIFQLGHDNDLRRSESAEMHWHPYASSIGPKAFAHQLRSLHTEDTLSIEDKLQKLNIPTRVVWSVSDPLPLKSGNKLAHDLKAPLLVIKGGKHFSPEDHPEMIAQAIKGVLIEVEEFSI